MSAQDLPACKSRNGERPRARSSLSVLQVEGLRLRLRRRLRIGDLAGGGAPPAFGFVPCSKGDFLVSPFFGARRPVSPPIEPRGRVISERGERVLPLRALPLPWRARSFAT